MNCRCKKRKDRSLTDLHRRTFKDFGRREGRSKRISKVGQSEKVIKFFHPEFSFQSFFLI